MTDQDPVEGQPPLADARCTYTADWLATKLRWQLTADDRERTALTELAAGCGLRTRDGRLHPGAVSARCQILHIHGAHPHAGGENSDDVAERRARDPSPATRVARTAWPATAPIHHLIGP
ncbi:hypothetical protein QF026_000018 [Streptomyces aurantiacus]|uniref:hypothetical protein n=1 Tax=Streptomyces aurantiacus TaxID=47760 RepID=UPI00278FD468|nr:hypothetical protein [Streptomyces aurantiacus]MDQ0771552.1 hypothetical protein [Streptomyces aurantiacus]